MVVFEELKAHYNQLLDDSRRIARIAEEERAFAAGSAADAALWEAEVAAAPPPAGRTA